MIALACLLIAIALIGSFLALSVIEQKRGARVFAKERARLDQETERALFILNHVDFAAYLREESQRFAERVGHDLAHFFLRAVRTAERLLTQLVRYFRTRQEVSFNAPRESAREFVKTLADFKGHLEATRPEVPDIGEVQ
jgi:hypothetical protein